MRIISKFITAIILFLLSIAVFKKISKSIQTSKKKKMAKLV